MKIKTAKDKNRVGFISCSSPLKRVKEILVNLYPSDSNEVKIHGITSRNDLEFKESFSLLL